MSGIEKPSEISPLLGTMHFHLTFSLMLPCMSSPTFTCRIPSHFLELKPERGDLKCPQLNVALQFPICPALLTIILQDVTLDDLLHRQAGIDSASALAPHRFIYPKNDALALSPAQLPSRYVFIVLTTLDAVKDEGV